MSHKKKTINARAAWVEACRIIAMKEFNLQFKWLADVEKQIVRDIANQLLYCNIKQAEEDSV